MDDPLADLPTIELTKIDVAEAHIRTAVRLFFEGCHPVPVYTLANAAREILTSIGEKTGIETVTYSLAKRRGVTHKSLVRDVKRDANYFKHADRDATDVLSFNEGKVYGVLQIACHDFGLITGEMPIEAQIYEVWVTALAFRRILDAP